jgi:hypothetical protein
MLTILSQSSKNIEILLLRKTIEGEERLKYDIQNHVPAACCN